MSKILCINIVYEMLLKKLTSFFSIFLYCFDTLFQSSSLLLFLLIKSEKLYFSSVMKILSKHFYLRVCWFGFFFKYFLEEKFGIQAHMACLGSYFSIAQNTHVSR